MSDQLETVETKRLPTEVGIYPVTLATGDRVCALWDGEHWMLWSTTFDPPEWEGVEWCNTRVVNWRMP